MLKEEVDEEDIARIVSKWTGIPVSRMLEGEVKKLVEMEQRLRERVVGQDAALTDCGECDSPFTRRLERSATAYRQLHFSRSHGRGQNRNRARAG